MAEERIINLDKVEAAIEKTEANPNLLKAVNAELAKLWENMGIELNVSERQYLLAQMASKAEVKSRENNGCQNNPGSGCINIFF